MVNLSVPLSFQLFAPNVNTPTAVHSAVITVTHLKLNVFKQLEMRYCSRIITRAIKKDLRIW